MDIVLSDRKLGLCMDELIEAAKKHDVDFIELSVDYDLLIKLEGLNGKREAEALKARLSQHGVRLFGFCLECSFEPVRDIMLAKKCVNLLNTFHGTQLRLVLKPYPPERFTENSAGDIVKLLKSTGRFAAYSAGGGKGETRIRLAYDLFAQSGLSFVRIMKMDGMIGMKNAGICLSMQNTGENGIVDFALNEVNMGEFSVGCAVVDGDTDAGLLEGFLSKIERMYDGPVIYELETGWEGNIANYIEIIKKHRFDKSLYDDSKLSYMSSVARKFRKSGTVELFPKEDVVAGTLGTWKYTYTVGTEGIKKGGGLKLCFHHSTNWQPFTLKNPAAEGYVSVNTTSKAKIAAGLLEHDACVFIHVTVCEGELSEGEQVAITVGDTSKGSPGSRAQKFRQKDFKFYTLTDTTGYGHYFQYPDPPSINIVGGVVERIVAAAPSVVYENEEFSVGVRVEDQHHNEAGNYIGKLTLKLNGVEVDGAKQDMTGADQAVVRFTGVKLEKEGIYFFEVCDQNGLSGTSNAVRCTSDRTEYKVYWGDIHGHLGYMDSVGTVEEFYHYAENVSFLDFVCHSEHMDSYSGDRQASNDRQWDIIKGGARKYDKPGKFAVVRGYENSELWDANVYFCGEGEEWHVDSFAGRLFDFAKRNKAIVVPHMTTYPQRLRGYDWSNYDPEVMPVAEIYSMHGSSEYFGGERPLKDCEPGGYIVDALNRGYKLGFIGSADGHDCMPGNSAGGFYMNGLVAVYAKELTREAVMEAIMNRRCYAATNARILGYCSINGKMPGSGMTIKYGERVKIAVSIFGTAGIKEVNIIKNGEIIHSEIGSDRIAEFEISDVPDMQGHNYYYVKMIQQDGEMMWLSPVFVETV